jgi:addiction module RelE/StbE family toxin
VRILWLQSAIDNLDQLRAYIADTDPGSAAVVVARILEAVDSLTVFPRRGRSGRVAGTRELVVPRTPYIVAYRIDDDVIVLLRILHGAQNWPSL